MDVPEMFLRLFVINDWGVFFVVFFLLGQDPIHSLEWPEDRAKGKNHAATKK